MNLIYRPIFVNYKDITIIDIDYKEEEIKELKKL